MQKPPKVCLACSGGGHLRQILLLKSVYQDLDHFFVTQKTPLAESAASEHRILYIPDVALGLLNRSPRAWWAFLRNFFLSLNYLLRERPDVIISTGAGAILNTLWLGRLLGARLIFVETFAHTRTPSLTGRLVSPLAHLHIVQWPALAQRFPRAKVISPLVETGRIVSLKDEHPRQTLVTVGTHGPFDRLLREVEKLVREGKLSQPVVAQVGPGGYLSSEFKCYETLDQTGMEHLLQQSYLLITHAGTGSILSGLKAGCKVIAITRQAQYGEHYDDHQSEILEEMMCRGAILGGKDPAHLSGILDQIDKFHPKEISISSKEIEAEILVHLTDWFGDSFNKRGN